MAECDHVLGIRFCMGEDEYVLVSNRQAHADAALAGHQRWLARGMCAPSSVARVRALDTPEKALAAQMDAFAYCPRCGAKLEGAQADG